MGVLLPFFRIQLQIKEKSSDVLSEMTNWGNKSDQFDSQG